MKNMAHHAIKLWIIRETSMTTIVTKNKESPEHGALSNPVERPNDPVVEVGRHSRQAKNDNDISDDIAHRSPRVLHPTMFGNRRSDGGQFERRRSTWVEFTLFAVTNSINNLSLLSLLFFTHVRDPQRSAHI